MKNFLKPSANKARYMKNYLNSSLNSPSIYLQENMSDDDVDWIKSIDSDLNTTNIGN
jgi:hypothetical protein